MALTQVTGPYPIFTDLDGTPLDDGYLYIGDVNQDPETNPIQVYWDSALTIPATQPIRTNSGYAYRNGTPALLYTGGEFSITIRNKRSEFVLYSPVGYGFDPAAVSASVVQNDFTGDGTTVAFTLSASPSTKLATSVFINGVYQEKNSYNVSGNTLTFTIAPPLSSSIEVMSNETGVIGSTNATLVSYTAGFSGAVAQTVQTKLEQTRSITDFGAVLDGVADCSPAINAAISSLPATGGTIIIPDGTGCRLETTIQTGTTKPVRFQIGCIIIKCPAGEHGIVLQSNGSTLTGAGQWSTVFELTAPASAMVLPTITTTLTTGAVTGTSIAGGSGMRSCPVAVLTESPAQADTQNPDAGLVLTQSGGTVSLASIVAAGTGYVSAPTVTIIGGGHAAVMIDNVQSTEVSSFSVDFKNVPGTVGVYHRGGWWVNVHDVGVYYNVTTGVSSENATSIGLVIDSYTLGSPGATGGYGGVYVSQYTNIHFTRRALIGHDTSTATTLQFNRCDFKNSWIHACIDIVDIGPVAQAATGYFYDLINVDGLTLVGGDLENTAGWFHFIGSCSNIKAQNTLAYSATGTRYRGQAGTGSELQFATTNSTIEPVRFGSGGSGGNAWQNTGWKIKGRTGFDYSGDTFTIGSINLKLTSSTQGNLDDTSQNGMAMFADSSNQIYIVTASAGSNPRTLTQFALFTSAGLKLPLLPSSAVTAGTKGLWYDPADGNRVKFVP